MNANHPHEHPESRKDVSKNRPTAWILIAVTCAIVLAIFAWQRNLWPAWRTPIMVIAGIGMVFFGGMSLRSLVAQMPTNDDTTKG